MRDASQIPDVSHLTGRPAGRTSGGLSSGLSAGAGVVAAGPSPSAALAIQSRLDAFLAAATPTYRTPDGDVQVSTPFRLAGAGPHEAGVKANGVAVRVVAMAIGMSRSEVTLIQQGRATPGQVQRLTQGLIDAGLLPPSGGGGAALSARIRQMMFDHGIGFDCAGYVRQAFVAAHPEGSAARWRTPVNEDLSGLAARGFARLSMSDAETGDIIVLKAPRPTEYGHTLIVYDAHSATRSERAILDTLARIQPTVGVIANSHCLRVLVVDSSWGSGDDAAAGGVQRQTWFEDQVSGKWLSIEPNGRTFTITESIYGHAVDGVYRPAGGS